MDATAPCEAQAAVAAAEFGGLTAAASRCRAQAVVQASAVVAPGLFRARAL